MIIPLPPMFGVYTLAIFFIAGAAIGAMSGLIATLVSGGEQRMRLMEPALGGVSFDAALFLFAAADYYRLIWIADDSRLPWWGAVVAAIFVPALYRLTRPREK
jgi:hypothetical protein